MSYDREALRSDDELPQCGENLARELEVKGVIGGSAACRELTSALHTLSKRCAALAALPGEPESCARWLLDNLYLAKREGAQAREDIKGLGALPRSGSESALAQLCAGLVLAGGGRVSEERLRLFLEGCQSVYVLSRRELAALLPSLRAAIIVQLAGLYSQDAYSGEDARRAGLLFTSLRFLAQTDLTELLTDSDRVEQLFLSDPAGVYPLMAEKTRVHYKRRLESLARKTGLSEHHLAQHLLSLCRAGNGEERHIGHYLFTKPLGEEKKSPSGGLYIASVAALTLLFALLVGILTKNAAAAALSLLPVYEIVKSLLDSLLLRLAPPAHVPRMELAGGVPKEGRTLCVIASLLRNAEDSPRLASLLEEYRLASRECGENLLFGLLSDLPDSESSERSTDEAVLRAAQAAIDDLNEKYGGGFYLFLRPREYNAREGVYMAHERKRGAVMALAALLRGEERGLEVAAGSALGLRGINYILTLDEDTRLVPGSARELIGAMLHPLNEPVIDEERKVVVSGHGLLHPRIGVSLSSEYKTRFSRLASPVGGADPYGSDCSELYMDVFQNGGFAGKGIISIDALRSCLDGRLPENAVLSHDALEGAFLRGGFMGDTELLDGFPSSFLSFQRRAHRWIRGDVQNLPWVFAKGSSLSPIDRFRLLVSVLRALFPAAALAALHAAFFFPGTAMLLPVLLSLLAMALPLIKALFVRASRPVGECARRSFSGVSSPVYQATAQLCYALLFLPANSQNALSAALHALWRMLVSHRRMLDWTTASALEGAKSGLLRCAAALWPALLFSAALLLCPSVIGKAAGVIWLLEPLCAYDLSRPKKKSSPLPEADRKYLLDSARAMFGFFSERCTAREHFLPPDNLQLRPDERCAKRTSPTNIGLCLVSCLAAVYLELTPRQNALGLIENILATLRRMPKWNGNLYNWYGTETLKPLRPAYVSSVDCGNLVACLMVLLEGLRELSQDDLAQQCQELLAPMSLAPFYDEKRRLFSLGWDAEKDALSPGCYDLMASEARITSFVAVARGDVPKKHWRQLSRAMCEVYGARGCASWTGSMFEYMMPRLFFISERGSLMYESEHLCVAAQQARTESSKLPWGCSESSYASLDPSLSYRYKAHGCAALALRRGMDAELVVSPYSSFLALPCAPRAAVKNLRRLEQRGLSCPYGFFEAIDFTPSRAGASGGSPVQCVMAHHLGMSIAAVCNTLTGDLLPRLFMAAPEARAFSSLLGESFPRRSIVLRKKEKRPTQRPGRAGALYWERRGEGTDPLCPECCPLSSGVYSLLLTDSGVCRALYRGLAPYYTPKSDLEGSHGVELYFRSGSNLTPLLPTPDMPEEAKSEWSFTLTGARISADRNGLRSDVVVSVPAGLGGERRVVSVSLAGEESVSGELVIALQPLLLPERDYLSHPAFARLGLHAKMRGGALILRRLERGATPQTYMCLAGSEPLSCCARGELCPGRGGLLAAVTEAVPSPLGWLYDPYVTATMPLRAAEGAECAVTVVLTVGGSENEVYSAACRMLTGESVGDFAAECAARLGLGEKSAEQALSTLPALCFPVPRSLPKTDYWSFGISGDLPVLVREIPSLEALPQAEEAVKSLAFLAALGISYDLVLLCNEGGDYLRPVSAALSALRSRFGERAERIHVIDSPDTQKVLALAAVSGERALSRRGVFRLPDTLGAPSQRLPEYSWLPEGGFRFTADASLPPRAWSNVLTNGRFGFIASDCGTGFMWFRNSREYAINLRPDSLRDTTGSETLTCLDESLFASPDGTGCTVSYAPGLATWEKAVGGTLFTLTTFVPQKADGRVLIAQWDDGSRRELIWKTDLVLGSGEEQSGVSVSRLGGVFTASRSDAPFEDGVFTALSNAEMCGFTTSRESFLLGKFDDDLERGEILALRLSGESPLVLVCGCDEQDTLYALRSPAEALSALEETRSHWQQALSAVSIETPLPALDRLINTWLPYQTLACRLLGRCSLYQSGGAVGFRDQLQDAVNIILLSSAHARAQILDCCRHQYTDGDVMHWWHVFPSGDRGSRSRCSDDLLWLCWALCEYCEKTGDLALCHEGAPWLSSRPLEESESDRYECPALSPLHSPVWEHALRALELTMRRGTGAHGLLKIGGGDWNDGFSAVGRDGESVWLTEFFIHLVSRFAPLLERLHETPETRELEAFAASLLPAVENAWDGEWYLRGYFEDGTPLGGSACEQCKIDSLAQSFAALCPGLDKRRINTALSSALRELLSEEEGLIKLFTPPFEGASPDPGYIQSYGPGFRENGGQYTHAAVWLLMALLREGRKNDAYSLLTALIPEMKDPARYAAEPYVLAADVYSNPDCAGHAGWSWYTGAAGWLYRVVTEELLGLRLRGGALNLSPGLPEALEGSRVRYRSPSGGVTDLVLSGGEPEKP